VTGVADGLRTHAEELADQELRRRGSGLAALPPDRRLRVEALARRVAAEVADGVLEHARGTPAVASALASIYGADGPRRSGTLVESALGTAD
jgi:hypothetical protein